MPNYIVIDGFEQLTPQQIFDMAIEHIGTTGVKSANANGRCLYSGTGCNAAPLLQTDHGKRIADSHGAWMELVELKDVPPHNADFIGQLQDAHDGSGNDYHHVDVATFKSDYLKNMRHLAGKHNLDTSTLDELALKWAATND